MSKAILTFDEDFKEYQRLKLTAQTFCDERIKGLESFSQTEAANSKQCYFHDQGCGYKCMDEFMP